MLLNLLKLWTWKLRINAMEIVCVCPSSKWRFYITYNNLFATVAICPGCSLEQFLASHQAKILQPVTLTCHWALCSSPYTKQQTTCSTFNNFGCVATRVSTCPSNQNKAYLPTGILTLLGFNYFNKISVLAYEYWVEHGMLWASMTIF